MTTAWEGFYPVTPTIVLEANSAADDSNFAHRLVVRHNFDFTELMRLNAWHHEENSILMKDSHCFLSSLHFVLHVADRVVEDVVVLHLVVVIESSQKLEHRFSDLESPLIC